MHIPTAAAVIASFLSLLPGASGLAHHVTPPPTPKPVVATATASTTECADGPWVGPQGSPVEGRPDGIDPGDRGAVYLWHDASGWHLRTTDATPGRHLYTGSIAASAGARFTGYSRVSRERDDHVWLTGDSVLHYSLTTYRGVDGFNFRASACGQDREHETLGFSMDYNGHEDDPSRIVLGDSKRHPDSATFTVSRAV